MITRLNVGGPSRHATILATRLPAPHRSRLLAGRPDTREGSLREWAADRGADLIEVPGLRRAVDPLNDLRALIFLYRHFRRTRPLLVATHLAKAGTLGRLAAFLARVPITVHTFHGHVLEGYFSRPATLFFRLVERLLSRITTQFIAISPEIAGDLERMGIGRGKTTLVRLGLDLDGLVDPPRGRLRAELKLDSAQPLVGIVGRLVPVKAHRLLLEAAPLVLDRCPDARFVVVGDGELWDELHRRVATAGLEGKVLFTGWRSDLAAVYGDLDVVVCCSEHEGTPVSIIEAGAAGRPVVGTRVGGMADLIEPGVNGLLVPSGQPVPLAEAIIATISDPEAGLRMGAAGRRLALARHSSERMVQEVLALYQRLQRGIMPPTATMPR